MQVKGGECGIILKKDAVPRRCPEPNWGHGAKRAILTKWARDGLASGEYEFAKLSPWASRPHMVQKTKRGSAKTGDDFGVRVIGDFVATNGETQKKQACAPNIPYQIERAAGRRAYWYTDGWQQYKG